MDDRSGWRLRKRYLKAAAQGCLKAFSKDLRTPLFDAGPENPSWIMISFTFSVHFTSILVFQCLFWWSHSRSYEDNRVGRWHHHWRPWSLKFYSGLMPRKFRIADFSITSKPLMVPWRQARVFMNSLWIKLKECSCLTYVCIFLCTDCFSVHLTDTWCVFQGTALPGQYFSRTIVPSGDVPEADGEADTRTSYNTVLFISAATGS